MNLTEKKCVPCEGGIPPLEREEAEKLLAEVPGWNLSEDGKAISREFKHTDFAEALAFTNKVGALAEAEGHHPDISIHDYKFVSLTLSTHAIGGLSENDFILAAKVARLL